MSVTQGRKATRLAPWAAALQSLVEWSDNHIAGKVLAAQGIHHGTAYHLVRRDSVALPTPVAQAQPWSQDASG